MAPVTLSGPLFRDDEKGALLAPAVTDVVLLVLTMARSVTAGGGGITASVSLTLLLAGTVSMTPPGTAIAGADTLAARPGAQTQARPISSAETKGLRRRARACGRGSPYLFGSTVQLAARLCSHAKPEQSLVSNAVAELCLGKGPMFVDLGEVSLKGFDRAVRVHAVEHSSQAASLPD